jgi:hypothetical protein
VQTNTALVYLGPVGRPHTGTPDAKDAVIEAIIEGRSLRSYCAEEGNPSRWSVLRWLEEDADFATRYARAREMQADLMDDKILEAADSTTELNAAAQRVKIDAYKWRASKLKPKRYGDKVTHDINVDHPAADARRLPESLEWLAGQLPRSGPAGGRGPDHSDVGEE